MKRRDTADTDATAVEPQEPQVQPPSLKPEPDRPPKRRRQPAYSCDFCRSKKLKCSGHPCSSCVSRGLQCVGGGDGGGGVGNLAWTSRIQPGRLHVVEAGHSHGRPELPILVQTVIAPGPGSGSGDSGPPVTITVTVTGPGSTQIQQQQQPSQQHQHEGPHPPSNSLAVPGVPARAPTGAAPLVSTPARIDTAGQLTANFLDSAYTQGVCGSAPRTGGTLARVIADGTLMTHDVAYSLLHMFVNNPCHLLVVIHEPSVRSLMDSFYSCLAGIRHASSTDSAVTKLNPWHAALILSIAATSAALLDEGMLNSSGCSFTSTEEATRSSLAWGRAAQQILEEARETAAMGSTSLEEVQARAILAYLVYNREGYSARFRFLHSCSVAAAREAGLHVVESGRAAAEEPCIDRVTRREIKRRLWWHITATDWMSGVMGGPFDGSYTIHPRHMRTRLPRNLNDNDLSALAARHDADTVTFPLNVPTQMSCFLQRIRLAEICRSIIDAREPSHPDEDVLSCARALELDSLFRSALDDFPPFMRLDAPVPPGAPCHFPLQRAIINIAFHSRRARLHRPFLLNGYQPWPAHHAPTHDGRQREQYQQCRITCLDSARAVVEIVVALFEASLTQAKSDQAAGAGAGAGFPSSPSSHGRPLAHRLAIFISHLFAACTVLACALHAPKTTESASDKAATNELVIKEDLSRACRVLEAAGRESPVAARLVQALTNSLRPSRDKNAAATDGLDDQRAHYPHVSCADSAPASTSADFTSVRGHHRGVVSAGGNAQTQAHVGGGGRAGAYADAGGNPGIVDFGLDALWSDFPGMLGSADNWDELFSSIDSSC